jgi:spore maturation protein CgeB
MAKLAAGDDEYLKADQVERFDLYLSFSGGPVLGELERAHGAVRARALYCSVDTDTYHPVPDMPRWHLGYLGTYSPDRQPGLEVRLLNAARSWPGGRFVVAGAQFPASIPWPANVERIDHVAPAEHAAFFAAQRFTLNLTRDAMCRRGYSPSVRLFEAAACGVPIISDTWPGLDTFFVPGREIFVSTSTNDTLTYLRQIDDDVRRRLADAARRRVLQEHSASQRARELEGYVAECLR